MEGINDDPVNDNLDTFMGGMEGFSSPQDDCLSEQTLVVTSSEAVPSQYIQTLLTQQSVSNPQIQQTSVTTQQQQNVTDSTSLLEILQRPRTTPTAGSVSSQPITTSLPQDSQQVNSGFISIFKKR